MKTDDELKAEFLARRGVTVCPAGDARPPKYTARQEAISRAAFSEKTGASDRPALNDERHARREKAERLFFKGKETIVQEKEAP